MIKPLQLVSDLDYIEFDTEVLEVTEVLEIDTEVLEVDTEVLQYD